MNTIKLLGFMLGRRTLCSSKVKYPGLLQQIAKRSMSTSVSISQNTKEKEAFNDALPGIIDNLQASPRISQLPEVSAWIKKILEYNLSGGKRSRGLITMLAYEMLENPENQTEENLQLSRVLGWCIEMLQAYFLVVDDIMDGSTTRRGVPCWYQMPNVGLGALNDSILMRCAIMETLETYFGKTPHFIDAVRLFNEALLYTSMGQHLDYTMAHHTKQNYSLFTIDRYESIVLYKTSCYTFRLPILLGMVLVQDAERKIYADDIDDISFKLGRLFQMQDDYIDCYGDESVTGKAGTDIQEGKCSWLAVTALEHCNKTQRALFEKHYASKEPEDVATIKNLYNELRLPELYRQEETKVYDSIIQRIQALPSEMASDFFFKLLNKIYKRQH